MVNKKKLEDGNEIIDDSNLEKQWFADNLTGNYNKNGERDVTELMTHNNLVKKTNNHSGGSEKMEDENQKVKNIDQVIESDVSKSVISEETLNVSNAYDALELALAGKGDLNIKSAYLGVLNAEEERYGVQFLNDKETVINRFIEGPLEMTSRTSDLINSLHETLLNLVDEPTKEELSEDEKSVNYKIADAFFTGSPILYGTLSPNSVVEFVEAGRARVENHEDLSDVLAYFRGESDDAAEQIDSLRKKQALEYESREDNYKRSVSNLGGTNKSLGYFLAAMTVAAGVGIGGWIYNAKTSVDPNVINEAKTELRLTRQDLDNERKMYSQDKKNYEDGLNGVLTALGSKEDANPVDEATKLKISYDNSQETLDTLKENLSLEEEDDLVETINGIQTKANNSWEAKITTNIADQTALLGVVDAYRNSLGGAIAVKGKSCDEALSNLYNAMTPENQNVELKNEFIKNATNLCGEIDPNKSYVLFGKRE